MKQELYFRMSALMKDDDRVVGLITHRGQEGFGTYISLLLELRKRDGYVCAFSTLDYLARQWSQEPDLLREIVCNYGLFECSGTDETDRCFSSPDLDETMAAFNDWQAENGKRRRATAVQKPDDSVQKPLETGQGTAGGYRQPTVKRAADGRFTAIREKCPVNKLNELYKTTTTSVSSPREETEGGSAGAVVSGEPDVQETFTGMPMRPLKPWTELLDEAFAGRQWVEVQAMQSGCGIPFVEQLAAVKKLFHDHVIGQGAEEGLHTLRDVRSYFSNFNRPGTLTHRRLVEFLTQTVRERSRDDPYRFEQLDPVTGKRTYCGTPVPDDAPPRPSEEAVWNAESLQWEGF